MFHLISYIIYIFCKISLMVDIYRKNMMSKKQSTRRVLKDPLFINHHYSLWSILYLCAYNSPKNSTDKSCMPWLWAAGTSWADWTASVNEPKHVIGSIQASSMWVVTALVKTNVNVCIQTKAHGTTLACSKYFSNDGEFF